MHLKTIELNHHADSLDEAMSLSKNQLYCCRERIFFSTIANALQGLELYGDEEAPREFHTKTGDLKRTLSLISDPLEYEYTLLVFTRLQDITQETVAKYLALHDENISASSKSKMQLMMNLAELVMEHQLTSDDDDDDDAEKSDSNDHRHSVTPGMLFKRIDLVKKSHYSWNTYYNMVSVKNFFYPKSKSSGSDFDIDGMLNNLFNNDGE